MTDKWIENINKINKQQEDMIELNIHNGKIIMLNTDKTYDKKYGTMLKTLDNQYIIKKIIKNKKNILKWRHIYSFLPSDTIETINQMIYREIYKNKVLNIYKPLREWKLYENKNENILMNEKLSISRAINWDDDIKYEKDERKIREEESYEMIDIEKETNIMEDKIRRNTNWYNINKCNMNTKNGKKCKCSYSDNINIKKYGIFVKSLCNYDEDYSYHYEEKSYDRDGLRYGCNIRLCGKHLNKQRKNYNEWDTIKKFYNDNGYDINKYGYCIKC
jgi:hypothetical protein